MFTTRIAEPFDSSEHMFEVAWDGVRALIHVEREQVRVVNAFGEEITWRVPELRSIEAEVNGTGLVLDGEIVVLDDEGVPQFNRLLPRLEAADVDDVAKAVRGSAVVFQGFDILYKGGRSVMNEPLRTRKRILRQVVRRPGSLSVPDYVERDGIAFFEAAREHGLAGTVSKHIESKYVPALRARDWSLMRVFQRDEFVIAGFTYGGTLRMSRRKHSEPFASLLIGAYDRWQRLHFVGEIAGGFESDVEVELARSMDGLVTTLCPFDTPPLSPRLVFWCAPQLVASVAFSRWTENGRLQFPRFEWLRPDVPTSACLLPESAA
jgi:bifunctional non-homologous end joining protein LigD